VRLTKFIETFMSDLALGLSRCVALVLIVLGTSAAAQSGLASRPIVAPYLNGAMPQVDPFNNMSLPQVPTLLSATGAFSNLQTLTPSTALIPYGVNAAFWSDGAGKVRYMAVPTNGPPYTATEVVTFNPTNEWVFPAGTVFVKNFDLVINKQTGERRRLETRILVRNANGYVYGRSYRWRANNSDADVVTSAQNEDISVVQENGTTVTQRWLYPSPSQCTQCHTTNSGGVLGANTRQLNGEFTYSSTGATANQLETLSTIGLFDQTLTAKQIAQFKRLVPLNDTSASLEDRVRSFLDSNCSSCHRGPGQGPGPLYDGRYDTPVLQQDLFDAAILRGDQGNSLIRQRLMSTTSPMPPVGRNVVYQEAVNVLEQWINQSFDVPIVYATGRPRQVRVAFNEPVNLASAMSIARYAIPGVTIRAARLESDQSTVTLFTDNLQSGATYAPVEVFSVAAATTTPNLTWPVTQKLFAYSALPVGGLVSDTRLESSSAFVEVLGSAFANVTFDPTTNVLKWTATARNLPSPLTQIDFHGPATGAQVAPVVLAAGSQLPLQGQAILNATQRAQVLAGEWYLNLKTAADPTGFLRGRVNLRPAVQEDVDLSGEGRSDLLLRSAALGSGNVSALLMNGTNILSNTVISASPGNWTVTHSDDFNGDGKADLVWQNTDGASAIWLMNGASFTSAAGILGAGSGWSITHTGDFNGDGKADLVWRNTDGSTALWLMNGTTATSTAFLLNGGSGWSVSRVGDLDGDGKTDLIWQNTDGSIAVWLMDGTTVKATGFLLNGNTGWSVSHVADLNGDGKADLIWQNTDGSVAGWLMNGTAPQAGGTAFLLGGGQGWSVTHVADLNGDGKADLIWRNTNGAVTTWLMNGTAAQSTAGLLAPGSNWFVKQTPDYNGDGKADLLWQNTDGSIVIWLMDGATIGATSYLFGPGTLQLLP
jgi:mono/diheme cytochrome c family protein